MNRPIAYLSFKFKRSGTGPVIIIDMECNGTKIRDYIETEKIKLMRFGSFQLSPPDKIIFADGDFVKSGEFYLIKFCVTEILVTCEPIMYQLITSQQEKLANEVDFYTLSKTENETTVQVHTLTGSIHLLKKFLIPTRRRQSKRSVANG